MIKGRTRIGPVGSSSSTPVVTTPPDTTPTPPPYAPTLIYSRDGTAAGDFLGQGVALSPSGDWLFYSGKKAFIAEKSGSTFAESAMALPTSGSFGGAAVSNDGLVAASGAAQLTRTDTASPFTLVTAAAPPSIYSDQYDTNTIDTAIVSASYDGQVIGRGWSIVNNATPRYEKQGIIHKPGSATNIGTLGTLGRGPKQNGMLSLAPGFSSTSADGQYILLGGVLTSVTTLNGNQVFGRFGVLSFDRYGTKSVTSNFPASDLAGACCYALLSADAKRIAIVSRTGLINFVQADTLSPTGFTNTWNTTSESFQLPGDFTNSNGLDPNTLRVVGNADLTVLALGMPSINAGPGQVMILQKTGAAWAIKTVISQPELVRGANFGTSVSMTADGTRVAVGAPGVKGPDGTQNYGKIFVYAI